MKPLSRRAFIKALKKDGFIGPFSGGKHPYFVNKQRGFKVHIPNVYGNKDIHDHLLSLYVDKHK